jgi:hypothetical protein
MMINFQVLGNLARANPFFASPCQHLHGQWISVITLQIASVNWLSISPKTLIGVVSPIYTITWIVLAQRFEA